MPPSVHSADEQTGLLKEGETQHDTVAPRSGHHSLNTTDDIDVCTAGGGTVGSHQGEADCARSDEIRRRRKEILFTHPDSENFWAEYEQREGVAGRSVRPNGAEIEKAHGFTRGEMRKMCEINESMEARHPHNILYRNHMAVQPPSDHLWKRGLIFLIIGFVMGCLGFIMFQSIAALAEERKKLLVHRVAKAYKSGSGDKSLYLFEAFLMWVLSGGALSLIAMLIIKWQPQAGGSGVTDVMAYLNGVFFTKVFNIRTLCAKAISCVAAVGSGLPVGPEGPMIHIGAILGAGIGSGRSKSFRFSLNTFFSSIRDPRDHRDVIAGGAAAGVAVAFGAPIGGLLFVFEEVATHWRPGLTPLIFIACLTGAYVYGVFSSQFEGWVPRHETSFGGLLDAATILFDSKADRFMYSRDLLSAGVIGMSTGLLATVFTKANVYISRKRIAASPTFRMIEPVLVLFVYLTISFLIPLAMKCSPVPLGHEEGSDDQAIDNSSKFFIHAPCHDHGEFSASATLFWSPGETVIKLMFRKHQGMDVPSLLLFTLMYFIFSCISSGMMISSGIVIPMLVTGGGIGRLWGLFINVFVDDSQHEGVFALMGAAGYFAGVSRLTVSLAVIMIELTSEKRCLLPLMVAIMSSKVVADRFGHSLYHCLLDLRCVPFLDPKAEETMIQRGLTCFRVSDMASKKIAVVRQKETVASLVNLLRGCSHHGFPVVEDAQSMRYLGMVTRNQIYTLLSAMEIATDKNLEASGGYGAVLGQPVRPNWAELAAVAEANFIRSKTVPRCCRDPEPGSSSVDTPLADTTEVELLMIADTSAMTVQASVAIPVAYKLFATMGLRHLPVINEFGCTIGMVTRADFLPGMLDRQLLSSIDWGSKMHTPAVPIEVQDWESGSEHTAETKKDQKRSSAVFF